MVAAVEAIAAVVVELAAVAAERTEAATVEHLEAQRTVDFGRTVAVVRAVRRTAAVAGTVGLDASVAAVVVAVGLAVVLDLAQ